MNYLMGEQYVCTLQVVFQPMQAESVLLKA